MIDSQTKALTAARAVLEKHGEDVVVLDLRTIPSVTDFFVIATAGSARQIVAVKDHVQDMLAQHGQKLWHAEGVPVPTAPSGDTPRWLLLDFGDIVVHILDEPARALYRLEQLWADAPRVPVALKADIWPSRPLAGRRRSP